MTDDKVPGEEERKNIASGCSAYIGKHITDVVKALTDVAQDVKCLAEVNDTLKTEMDATCVSKCEVDRIKLENEALRAEFQQLKGLKEHVENLCRENDKINNSLSCHSTITGPPQEDPAVRMDELKDVVLGIKYDGNPCEMLERAERNINPFQNTTNQPYDMNPDQFCYDEDPCADCVYCCKVPDASLQRAANDCKDLCCQQGRSEYTNNRNHPMSHYREAAPGIGHNKHHSPSTRNCAAPEYGKQCGGAGNSANYVGKPYEKQDGFGMNPAAKNINDNRDTNSALTAVTHPWRKNFRNKVPTMKEIKDIDCAESCRKDLDSYCGSACQKHLLMAMHMARQNAKVEPMENMEDNEFCKKNANDYSGHACQKHMEMAMNMARQNAKVEPCAELAKIYSNVDGDKNAGPVERQNSKVEELKKHLDNGYSRNYYQNKGQNRNIYNNPTDQNVNQQLLEIQNYANNLKATDAAKIGRELSKVVKCVKKLQKNNLMN